MPLAKRASLLIVLTGLALPHSASTLAQAQPDAIICIQGFEPGRDYFPEKVQPEYAENFSVTYHDTYKIVTVNEPFVGGAAQTYVLVQCGTPIPDLVGELDGATVIQTPIASMFSASTTHNPMIAALGATHLVTGVGSLAYATTPEFLDAGEQGLLVEFATTGAIDVEIVVDSAPSIFMTGGSDDPAHDLIASAGIPVVANAEWLEATPLGRAEWIKFIALFLNEEARANQVFGEIEASYLGAAAAVADIPTEERPLVLAGSAFQGTFYASGGQSYVAQTIEAAGGRYVFADDTGTASIAFPDLEIVLDRAADAPFWINSAIAYRSLADIEADDPRLSALAAVQSGAVWNYDLISTPAGGVAFFELGVLRPDLVLRDLIEIFHPGTLPDHDFAFYRQVGSN